MDFDTMTAASRRGEEADRLKLRLPLAACARPHASARPRGRRDLRATLRDRGCASGGDCDHALVRSPASGIRRWWCWPTSRAR
jgi:uncharacterized protein with von Willebrand factor type A (vWA) domain